MAISERQAIPEDLPPARLYLDDVEEIVELFTAAADPTKSEGEKPTVKFRVGNFECDRIEELKELGTRANNFGILVGARSSAVAFLRITRNGTYWSYGSGLRKVDAFRVYGHLNAIFEARKIRWRAFCRSIPPWLPLLITIFILISMLKDLPVVKSMLTAKGIITLAMGTVLSVWISFKIMGEHSVVEFRRAHDPDPGRIQKKLSEWKPYIIGTIAGGVIKEIIDSVAHAIRH